MNMDELISANAKKCGLNKSESKELLEATISAISEILINQNSIGINNFGTFNVHLREKHRFFDPIRSKIMMAPAKIAVSFRPSKNFSKSLNEKLGKK